MANCVDLDQVPLSVASDLGLHSLHRLSVPIFRVVMVHVVSFEYSVTCEDGCCREVTYIYIKTAFWEIRKLVYTKAPQ